MGQGPTPRLIYQNATSERDHRIAEALDLMIREARRPPQGREGAPFSW